MVAFATIAAPAPVRRIHVPHGLKAAFAALAYLRGISSSGPALPLTIDDFIAGLTRAVGTVDSPGFDVA